MMSRATQTVAFLALAAMPAPAHRLDEYLQGTILSVEKDRLQAQMTLTPGVAVFSGLFAYVDTDADGVISDVEQRAYAGQVLHDVSLRIDDHLLTPQLLSIRFPATSDMKEGRGEIQLSFSADLPPGGRSRNLVFENHHQSRISAYQVNVLVPRDPEIRIAKQGRNQSQSFYRLDFMRTDVHANPSSWTERLGAISLLLFAGLLFAWRQRANTSAGASPRPR